jgi:hypothetical protein
LVDRHGGFEPPRFPSLVELLAVFVLANAVSVMGPASDLGDGHAGERRVELCGGGTGRSNHPAKFVAGIVLHFVSYRRHLFS